MTQPPPPTPPAAARPAAARRPGFTLVELLVVIGIIVLLIAILLPVAGKVRISAQTAKTRSSIAALAGAIERYFADERSYPGLFSNAELAASKTLTGLGGGPELTSSENLVGSLVGGFIATSAAGLPDSANLDQVGKGPIVFSTSAINRKRRPAYIEAGPGNLLPAAPFTASGIAADAEGALGGAPAVKDTSFPEFYDSYSNPRPIIYLRANVGAIVGPAGSSSPNTLCDLMTNKSTNHQYSTHELTYYQRSAAGDFPGDFQWGSTADEYYASEADYLVNPATADRTSATTLSASAPRGQDKYILISAGPDRIFGTKDDIFYGGN